MAPIREVTPFDEFGHRKIVMPVDRKQATIYQGITEITPIWTKVEGLQVSDAPTYIWDQRIATNCIPHRAARQDPAKANRSEEHRAASEDRPALHPDGSLQRGAQELAAIIKDFPDRKEDFARTERELRQRYALRMLAEIKNRRDAGQHQLVVQYLLKNFPSEGVAGETLQTVKEMLDQYKAEYARGKKVLDERSTNCCRRSPTPKFASGSARCATRSKKS